MKLLITGAHGQTARALHALATARGHDVLALSHAQLDITHKVDVERVVKDYGPTHVVNAAAYNAVDAAEDDEEGALAVNAAGPGNLALAAGQVGAVMVHYSTDMVFDGVSATPRVEEDAPRPLSAYGRSKLLGEQRVREALPQSHVVRTSWVFGRGGNNFVTRVLQLAAQGRALTFVDDVSCSPTYAPDLAWATLEILRGDVPFGVHHCVGSDVLTPWRWARAVLERAGVTAVVTATRAADYKTRALRPQRVVLSTEKLAALGVVMPGGLVRLTDFFQSPHEDGP
jgi:dTDP-4-dehydrorhamnose reductase